MPYYRSVADTQLPFDISIRATVPLPLSGKEVLFSTRYTTLKMLTGCITGSTLKQRFHRFTMLSGFIAYRLQQARRQVGYCVQTFKIVSAVHLRPFAVRTRTTEHSWVAAGRLTPVAGCFCAAGIFRKSAVRLRWASAVRVTPCA